MKIDIWISPEGDEGGKFPAGVERLAAEQGQIRWIGFKTPAGPTSLPKGAPRYAICLDRAEDWIASAEEEKPGLFTRWAGRELANNQKTLKIGGALTLLMMDVEEAYEEEFNAWYDTEHLPHVNRIPGILLARRFRADIGAPRYLQMFHANERDVVQRSDFWRYRYTPWTQRMWPKVRNVQRYLFQPMSYAGED